MDTTPPPVHHAISYVEFSAPDLAAIKAFYGAAFGWTFTDWGDDYIDFNGPSIGGGFSRGPTRPGGALVILYSNGLEASQEAVTKAGGAIVKPVFSFPGGRRFHFADPAGNELAVWSDK